ncbi:hypothetical protein N1851_012116 [Merluccius polli]|uniref:Uncharacterized protein n=1 Tax=Merluccius polli TaxID=89951 RepID=A0AA47NXC6_MERPO|nr:hypothetical protein N1851_020012 [Merluccius polli]KAK0148169.1 hypothetical protein N1851_012116 [Merluccius polli]
MDEHYKKNESMSGKHQHHQRRHGKNVCQPKTGLSSPTVEEIVAEYPRFVDMPYLNLGGCFLVKLMKMGSNYRSKYSENIHSDTSKAHPVAASNLIRERERLRQMQCKVSFGLPLGYKAGSHLSNSFLLNPPPPSHPQIGTSISSLLNPPERLVGYHQPHLVCIGQPNATAQYVIVAEKDKVAIPLEDYGLSFAIDKLFKMIWVCNAVYPAQLTSYRFCYC